ncbi:hypothetical protein ON010_g13116 [Phytophthora cinnamomi]|nr:hypothetical protein ON010_g13116 [Phytophthora cinnamomi]
MAQEITHQTASWFGTGSYGTPSTQTWCEVGDCSGASEKEPDTAGVGKDKTVKSSNDVAEGRLGSGDTTGTTQDSERDLGEDPNSYFNEFFGATRFDDECVPECAPGSIEKNESRVEERSELSRIPKGYLGSRPDAVL